MMLGQGRTLVGGVDMGSERKETDGLRRRLRYSSGIVSCYDNSCSDRGRLGFRRSVARDHVR